MNAPSPSRRVARCVASVTLLLAGCDDTAAPTTLPRWACPESWVPYARGGCGPAVLLCAPGGGALAAVCEGVDVARSRAVVDPDGAAGLTLRRRDDGAIAGAWPEPGAMGGPPDEGWTPKGVPDAAWSPEAGIATCPEGWSRRDDGSCDPRLRSDCAVGALPLPGGACTTTSAEACPSGEYPDVSAEAGGDLVVRVREGADDVAADGSAPHPFGSVAAAVARVGARGWVLVARGTYRDPVVITGELHLVGACAAGVTLTRDAPSGDPSAAVVTVARGASLDLRAVRVWRGGVGVDVAGGAHASARSARIEGAAAAGVMVRASGDATLDDVTVTAGRGLSSGVGGHGVDVSAQGRCAMTRAHVGSNRGHGVVASGSGAAITLRDVVVRGTDLAMDAGYYGGSVAALRGGRVTADRLVVADNALYGLVATGAGSTLTARDAVVSGTLAVDGTSAGYGLFAREGARLDATRVDVAGNRTAGAAVTSRATLTLADALVRGTRGTQPEDGAPWVGAGVVCFGAGALRVQRARVTDNDGVGVDAIDAGCEVSLDDGVVAGGAALPDGAQGLGAVAAQGAQIALRRVEVRDAHDAAVLAVGEGSLAAVTASVLRGTRPRAGAPGAVAVSAQGGARVTLAGVRVRDTVGLGAMAGLDDDAPPAALDLDDVVIEDTAGSPEVTELVGVGLRSTRGSQVTARRVRVSGSARSGVAVDGASLSLRDGVVRDTGAASGPGVNFALAATGGAQVTLERVLIARTTAAVAVGAEGEGTSLTASDCTVRDTTSTRGRDHGGQGVTATRGASLTMSRCRVAASETLGVSAYHAGTRVTLRDVSVEDTAAGVEGGARVGGAGLLVGDGAVGVARRLVVTRSHDVGVWSAGEGSSLTLDDGFVLGVSSVDGRYGEGVAAMAGGSLRASRLAVLAVAGFALGAAVSDEAPATPVRGAALTVDDAFAREVTPSTLRPATRAVAYGIHVGVGCGATVTRAVIDGSEWGFFRAGGSLTLRDALLARQVRGAGASNGGSPQGLVLERVASPGAAAVAYDIELPEALLPSPPAP